MPDDLDFTKDRLRRAEEKAKNAEKTRMMSMVQGFAEQTAKMLAPLISQMRQASRLDQQEMTDAIKSIKIESNPVINVPKQERPTVNVQPPRVTVQPTPVTIPPTNFPDEMDIRGWVNLMAGGSVVGDNNPLPVTIRDAEGNPIDLIGGFNTIIQSGGGGARTVRVTNDSGSPIPVSISSGSTSATEYTEADTDSSITGIASMGEADSDTLQALRLGAGHDSSQALRVTHATDATVSVNIVSGSSSGTEYADGGTANPPSGAAAIGNTGEESGNMFVLRTGAGVVDSATIRVQHAADAVVSVNIVSGSSSGTEYADGDTAEPATGTVAMGDTGEESGNIFALRTASGVVDSSTLRVVLAVDAVASVNIAADASGGVEVVQDTAGDLNMTEANSAAILADTAAIDTATAAIQTAVEIMDDWDESDRAKVNAITGQAGVAADEGEADVRTIRVVHAGDVGVSVSASIVADSSGGVEVVQDTAADLNVTEASAAGILADTGAIQTAVEIMDDWDATHDSAASSDGVQVMGEARTSNPTAVGNGDAVRPMHDDLGRQVVRNVTVRDLALTAYATISSDAETTLISGTASTFKDLIYVTGANQSDGAATLDVYCGSGGSVLLTLEIPANATAGIALPVPIPMTEAAQAWYVDWADSDVTGTTVDVSALFSTEV